MKFGESSLAGLFFAALVNRQSFLPADLFAQTAFYQGKTITIIQGRDPGGTGDMRDKSFDPLFAEIYPREPHCC